MSNLVVAVYSGHSQQAAVVQTAGLETFVFAVRSQLLGAYDS
jgi:hypothetical protein